MGRPRSRIRSPRVPYDTAISRPGAVAESASRHEATAFSLLLAGYMKMRMKSQEDVAIACGVSQATVSGWVRGTRRAPLDLLHELAEALHLSDAEQARLAFAACEAYTPRLVWERLVELEQEVGRLHRMAAELAAQEQLLAAEVAALAPEAPQDGQVGP